MAIDLATDYLALGGLIKSRLEEKCPDLRRVFSMLDLHGFQGETTPCAMVMFQKDLESDSEDAEAGAQVVGQVWAVMVAVESARQSDAASEIMTKAGRAIAQVHAAMVGWRPDPSVGWFVKTPSPQVAVDRNQGRYFFSILFTIATPIEGGA